MALTQLAIVDTDTFLVQRPSSLPDSGSNASAPVFKVSAKDVGLYAATKFEGDVIKIIDDLKIINELVANNRADIDQNYNILMVHDAAIKLNTSHIEDNRQNINANRRSIEQLQNRSAISMYYKANNENKTGPGLMIFKQGNGVAQEFKDVDKISYNHTDVDGNELTGTNFFVGDTLEVSSKNVSSNQLTHRAAYKILSTEIQTSYFRFTVEYLSSTGTGIPFYDETADNLVRTDIYPNFSITEDNLNDALKDYVKRDGSNHMTGNLTIKNKSAGIDLKDASSTTHFTYNKPLTFSYRTGSSTLTSGLTLNQDGIDVMQNITMGGTGGDRKRIYNLPEPQDNTEPATKLYVDGKFQEIESDLDIYEFAPGDAVANDKGGAKRMGFYWDGNQLYFQT